MKKRILTVLLAIALVCTAALSVFLIRLAKLPVYKGGGVFATFMPLTYEKMVDAPYILTGKVIKKVPREGIEITKDYIQRYCYSRVTVQVDEVLKGEVGKNFHYRELGGTSKEGWVYRVDYSRQVEVGDEVLIFAQKENAPLYFETVFLIRDGMLTVRKEDVPGTYLQRLVTEFGREPENIELSIEEYLEILRNRIARQKGAAP